MSKNYEPRKLEVLMEIARTSPRFIKDIYKGFKRTFLSRTFVKSFIGTLYHTAISPYVIPTRIRQAYNCVGELAYQDSIPSRPEDTSGEVGCGLGITGGLVSWLAQIYLYNQIFGDDIKGLLIPAATNVASLIYEIGKNPFNRAFSNAKIRLIERKRGQKSIDDIIEE